jgi:hypothetical protein
MRSVAAVLGVEAATVIAGRARNHRKAVNAAVG